MIERLDVGVYRIPLDEPEADGTLAWEATTVVVVQVHAEGHTGLGFTYGPRACATVVEELLREAVLGGDPMDVEASWHAMVRAVRNAGRPGISSMAIAAVDTALWDLKARTLGVSLGTLLGVVRTEVPVYGSGGFTSLDARALAEQLGGWVHRDGIPRVKMKIGTNWGRAEDRDIERVRLARDAVGEDAELYVDANGAYTVEQAIRLTPAFDAQRVTWFEEPVSSDDLEGLRAIADATRIEVAAGEYGYDARYFERMAPCVDVLQADVSRCAGITEWLRVAAIAATHGREVSGHCAQSLHAHPACAVPNLRHLEYFADHARADRLLFDGVLDPAGGALRPDLNRPGNGLELKRPDADRFAVVPLP